MAAAAEDPIILEKIITLPSIGNDTPFSSTHVTMESDNYICIRKVDCLVIVDMKTLKAFRVLGFPADSALMHPSSRIIALKARIQATGEDYLRIYDIDSKTMINSYKMPEEVTFWKWISPRMLGLVTQTSVYHWFHFGNSKPMKMFGRIEGLANHEIINYQCDPTGKWLLLIGIAPGTPEKGIMQLFSVVHQRDKTIEARAASFAQFEVPDNQNPLPLICYGSNTLNDAGQVKYKLHLAELCGPPGGQFPHKQADIFFPGDFADDHPISVLISNRGFIFVISHRGLLFLYNLETFTIVYSGRISQNPIVLTSTGTGGVYVVSRSGEVRQVTINEQTIVKFVAGRLNKLELAIQIAQRLNLYGAQELEGVVKHFHELLSQKKYKEASKVAADSPQGILRTDDTVAKFQKAAVQAGEDPPLLQYFAELLSRGKLDAFESFKYSQLVLEMKQETDLRSLVQDGKLECSVQLGDLVKPGDSELAVEIYLKADGNQNAITAFADMRKCDEMRTTPKQGCLAKGKFLGLFCFESSDGGPK